MGSCGPSGLGSRWPRRSALCSFGGWADGDIESDYVGPVQPIPTSGKLASCTSTLRSWPRDRASSRQWRRQVLYPNFAAAYASEDGLSTQIAHLLIVLSFSSIVTSYIGTTTLFSVAKWKARIWFGVLPALAYVVAFGLIAALFSLLGQRAA